ncbi:hypothetical protein J2Z76_001478 [Sedimentibacter acidaminivorans]|uniref:Uncharacterized protein n=1 Tax=Sedimentibacter acidaminivorans TaxID=913099 RepID=A0ABS4GD55_9FIRM|nr:hypothetical protein [Sedimentibacter acidaminivorans]MBP1925619.1 hypothetical protein [Sedimentibacter acidaminivorans]
MKTTDESKSKIKYFGAPLEPEKGIILGAYAEGGASYADLETGLDITSYSAKQIKDFYMYLPIKYPMFMMKTMF